MGILTSAVMLLTVALATTLFTVLGGAASQHKNFNYFPDFRYPDPMVNPSFMSVNCVSEGVFPHPYNCTWFYRCHDRLGSGFFVTSYFICAPGTEFDDDLDLCIPKSRTCGGVTDPCRQYGLHPDPLTQQCYECLIDSHCVADEYCTGNNSCADPCPQGYHQDPSTGKCHECLTDSHCTDDKHCNPWNKRCEDPCLSFYCDSPSTATCRVKKHQPVCYCLEGYHQDPSTGSCRECLTDSHCLVDKHCTSNKRCEDPCPNYCDSSSNAVCKVTNHQPVCSCPEGYQLDGLTVCKVKDVKWICSVTNGKVDCECPEGFQWDMITSQCISTTN